MRSRLVGLTLAFAVPWAACQAQRASVPFVGCPADGQLGPIEAPKGQPKIASFGDVPEQSPITRESKRQGCLLLPAGIAAFGTDRRAAVYLSLRRPSTQRTSCLPRSWGQLLKLALVPPGPLVGSVWPATARDYSQGCSPPSLNASRVNTLPPILTSTPDNTHVTQ